MDRASDGSSSRFIFALVTFRDVESVPFSIQILNGIELFRSPIIVKPKQGSCHLDAPTPPIPQWIQPPPSNSWQPISHQGWSRPQQHRYRGEPISTQVDSRQMTGRSWSAENNGNYHQQYSNAEAQRQNHNYYSTPPFVRRDFNNRR
jgi:RNA recognition motif-containing protein